MIRRPPSSTLFPSTPLFRPPRLGPPVARPEPGEQQGLELRRRSLHQEGKGRKSVVVGKDLHQHLQVRDVGERRETRRSVGEDRKSTRLNSSHANISYAVFCL